VWAAQLPLEDLGIKEVSSILKVSFPSKSTEQLISGISGYYIGG
jgi:hypothetical protein